MEDHHSHPHPTQERRRSKNKLLHIPNPTLKPKRRFPFRKRHIKHLPIEALTSFDDDSHHGGLITPQANGDAVPWRPWSEGTEDTAQTSFHLSDDEPVLTLSPKRKDSYHYAPDSVTKIALYSEPDNLRSSVQLWLEHANQLLHSQEVENLIQSSGLVAYHSARLVVSTVTLPIVVPVQITTSAVGCVLETSTKLLLEDKNDEEHNQGLLWGIVKLPGAVLELTTKMVVGVIAPQLLRDDPPRPSPKKLEYNPPSPSLSRDYLDRLRIDYLDEPVTKKKVVDSRSSFEDVPLQEIPSTLDRADTSKYLLRVNDLGIELPEGRVYYIDLSNISDHKLVDDALDSLVSVAFSMLANHSMASLQNGFYLSTRRTDIEWNPEGATKRLLRTLGEVGESEHVQVMLRESLVWSGKFSYDTELYGRKHGFYLARGSIPMSPRALMELLWDNDRTHSYNNFCLGRSTLLSISDDADEAILSGKAHRATKVIKSEMRVPFAGITVKAVCLMHVVPLEAPDSGYAILSRTLDRGTAGTHLFGAEHGVERTKNEILWGCNILRAVPGYPSVTDLVSLSQVGSNVPGFLANKIGLLGVSDFFKNVRNLATHRA